MSQSKTDSAMEALTNIVIGLIVSFTANAILLPWFLGVTISAATNIGIAVAYTIVSFARSYAIRRLFNGKGVWESLKGWKEPLLALRDWHLLPMVAFALCALAYSLWATA